jgi:diguanylate cyclase (GGDEF)-like protein
VAEATTVVRTFRPSDEAEAMAEIAQRISSAVDLEEALQTIADTAMRLARADVSFIALPEPDGSLRVAAAAGGTVPEFVGLHIPAGTGMGARAMLTGEPVIQRTYWENPSVVHHPKTDQLMEEHLREGPTVALPILNGDTPVAVLWAARHARGRYFTSRDLTLLTHLTAQAAIAISQARALANERQAREEAAALANIGERISESLDLQHVLQTTVEAAHRLVSADITVISLPAPEGGVKNSIAYGNRSSIFVTLVPPKGGMGGQAIASGEAVQTTWGKGEAGGLRTGQTSPLVEAEGVASSLVMPIRRGEETLGLFWVHSRTPRTFTPAEIDILKRLSGQVAVGIVNARTHADEQTARAQIEALLAATAGLGGRTEPSEILRAVVEQSTALLNAELASYATINDGRPVVAGYWRDGAWFGEPHDISVDESIQGLVWRTLKPYRTNDLEHDENTSRELDRSLGLRSQITVPLVSRVGEPEGLVSVFNSRRATGFTEDDLRLLMGFAEYASSAYRRARAGAARAAAEQEANLRRRELQALLEITDRLTAANDPGEILQGIMEVIAPLLPVRRIGIVTNEGEYALSGGLWDDGVWHPGGTRIPLEGSISGWVIRNKKMRNSPDLEHDPLHFQGITALQGVHIGASLALPIIAGDGRVLGVLNLHSEAKGEVFGQSEIRLAEGMARHLAVAIERARLVRNLRESEERLRRQAYTDALTGLPNRAALIDRLDSVLKPSRHSNRRLALIFLDLDGFKLINDSLGHFVGDEVLSIIGERLRQTVPEPNMVARLGGDEFVVMVEDARSTEEANALAERLVSAIQRPFRLRGRERYVSASAGVTLSGTGKGSYRAERLLREADIALYVAKARGKSRTAIFEPDMSDVALARMDLETDLQRAIDRNELDLYYQPIFDLNSAHIEGVEALVRWNHPRRGLLAAEDFIYLAEESGLILSIGDWALERALRSAAAWRVKLGAMQPILSVNLSALQFQQPNLLKTIATTLRETGMDPRTLEIEITESAMIQDLDRAIGTMQALRDSGIRLAIDDFGTGYSSLNYLRRLTVDRVKIDQSFVAGIGSDPGTATIVRSVVDLAHALGISVTAEGIETAGQLDFLRTAGCDFGQGYLLSFPVPHTELNNVFTSALA